MSVALSILAIMVPAVGGGPPPVAVDARRKQDILDDLGGAHRGRYWRDPPKVPWRIRMMRRVVAPYRAWLARVRWCESGSHGLYRANTGNGFYGAYQFTLQSWAAVGGVGLPSNAPPLEQDYRAVKLLHLQGPGAWPVCG